jgi:hypothetical protein
VTQVLSKLTEQQINQLKKLTCLPVEQLDKLPISDSQKVFSFLFLFSDTSSGKSPSFADRVRAPK